MNNSHYRLIFDLENPDEKSEFPKIIFQTE
jgi:hypothetical protein